MPEVTETELAQEVAQIQAEEAAEVRQTASARAKSAADARAKREAEEAAAEMKRQQDAEKAFLAALKTFTDSLAAHMFACRILNPRTIEDSVVDTLRAKAGL
jgi:hypothetical protein